MGLRPRRVACRDDRAAARGEPVTAFRMPSSNFKRWSDRDEQCPVIIDVGYIGTLILGSCHGGDKDHADTAEADTAESV
jgi:hypothetical protein